MKNRKVVVCLQLTLSLTAFGLSAQASSPSSKPRPTPGEVRDIHIAKDRAPDAGPGARPDTTPKMKSKTVATEVPSADRPVATEPSAP